VSELIPFEYSGRQVRVFVIDGEPWFALADVAAVLGYRDAHNAARVLRDSERRTHSVSTNAGSRNITACSEPGLYRLIMRSKRPEAEPFQDWVVGEVLPALRKTGGYLVNPDQLDELEVAERYVATLKAKRELEAQLAIAGPKAEYVDAFVNGVDDASTIRVVANQVGVGEQELRQLLMDHKAVYRKLEGRRWSQSKGRMVAEYSWHAYAEFKTWFVERDQPEAPRYHNGQIRTTLYVTPVGKVQIAALVQARRSA
jgi:anti-repressor protein